MVVCRDCWHGHVMPEHRVTLPIANHHMSHLWKSPEQCCHSCGSNIWEPNLLRILQATKKPRILHIWRVVFRTNQAQFKHISGQRGQENAATQRVPFSPCPCFWTKVRWNRLCTCQMGICQPDLLPQRRAWEKARKHFPNKGSELSTLIPTVRASSRFCA